MYESQQRKPTLPRQAFHSPKRSGVVSADARLSIIAEDGVAHPRPSQNTHHRPFSRRWNLGDPPRHSFEVPPPKYALWDVTGPPKSDKLADVRNNKHIAKRGGWRRTCLIALLVTAVVVALVVGLVVGLRNRAKKSSTAKSPVPSDSSSASSSVGPFPVGTYSFKTFLANVTADCVSNSSDWSCIPYHTYVESPSQAMLTYQWIISDTNNDTSNLTISSSNNPFAFDFANSPLTLVDAGQDTERYTFSAAYDKVVITSLGVHCLFPSTTLEASLFTKRKRSYPSKDPDGSTPVAPQTSNVPMSSLVPYADWEYATDVTHSHGGGPTVPECYQMENGVRGARVIDGRTPKTSGDLCSCIYRNHDP